MVSSNDTMIILEHDKHESTRTYDNHGCFFWSRPRSVVYHADDDDEEDYEDDNEEMDSGPLHPIPRPVFIEELVPIRNYTRYCIDRTPKDLDDDNDDDDDIIFPNHNDDLEPSPNMASPQHLPRIPSPLHTKNPAIQTQYAEIHKARMEAIHSFMPPRKKFPRARFPQPIPTFRESVLIRAAKKSPGLAAPMQKFVLAKKDWFSEYKAIF